MSFQAKYKGACADCDDPVYVGQEVEYSGDRFIVHVVCPVDAYDTGIPRPVCPHCFMVLPVTGVCECRE